MFKLWRIYMVAPPSEERLEQPPIKYRVAIDKLNYRPTDSWKFTQIAHFQAI